MTNIQRERVPRFMIFIKFQQIRTATVEGCGRPTVNGKRWREPTVLYQPRWPRLNGKKATRLHGTCTERVSENHGNQVRRTRKTSVIAPYRKSSRDGKMVKAAMAVATTATVHRQKYCNDTLRGTNKTKWCRACRVRGVVPLVDGEWYIYITGTWYITTLLYTK